MTVVAGAIASLTCGYGLALVLVLVPRVLLTALAVLAGLLALFAPNPALRAQATTVLALLRWKRW
ncbi:hypothetical protein GCM10012275_63260 [Longimycelium tulufanense]|uniref:Uncharacterized protein n=1 Tax=Longimycelium tulufanense TaxID=907463 RepID=A0A8J3FZE6_9PSEU|nr:hypothetical protein [Longimycelium tulufanense]GGM83988.1 hypothetical protein GCM10012275_63260 [Longimycelium tulufanense]